MEEKKGNEKIKNFFKNEKEKSPLKPAFDVDIEKILTGEINLEDFQSFSQESYKGNEVLNRFFSKL